MPQGRRFVCQRTCRRRRLRSGARSRATRSSSPPARTPAATSSRPTKHDITIRGADRNDVVLDGADARRNGIVVHADGVSILNLSAHNFPRNAFYWEGADRFRASYVTVWNVGSYGIYAEDSEQGVLDHDYVSGAGDAAYYVGECKPCAATLSRVVARLSAVGYSGTNATGVVIRDSVWDRNGAGIVPNTYANEALPPQSRTTIVRNTVTKSGRARVPIQTPLAGFIGIGIAVAGGNENASGKSRHAKRAVRHRRLPDGALRSYSTRRSARARTAVAAARQPRLRQRRLRERARRSRAREGLGEAATASRPTPSKRLPRGLQTRASSHDGDASSRLSSPVRSAVMFERRCAAATRRRTRRCRPGAAAEHAGWGPGRGRLAPSQRSTTALRPSC